MITITGGAGFIGSRVCKGLSDEKHSFRIVDIKAHPEYPEAMSLTDIRDIEALSEGVTGDTIIHLAAIHTDNVSDVSKYDETNVTGTANVCEAARRNGINQIVFTSSVAVFGFAEPDTDEDGPIDYFNDYGRTKYEAEQLLRAWQAEDPGRSLVIVRPTVVFGEGNRGNVFNLFNQIYQNRFVMVGDGKNRKSIAYVGNIERFIRKCCDFDSGVHIFNYIDKPDLDMNTLIGKVRQSMGKSQGVGIRIPKIVATVVGGIADGVEKVAGKKFVISSVRVKKFTMNTCFASRAHDVDGFTAPYSLDEAIDCTIEADFLNPDPNARIFFVE